MEFEEKVREIPVEGKIRLSKEEELYSDPPTLTGIALNIANQCKYITKVIRFWRGRVGNEFDEELKRDFYNSKANLHSFMTSTKYASRYVFDIYKVLKEYDCGEALSNDLRDIGFDENWEIISETEFPTEIGIESSVLDTINEYSEVVKFSGEDLDFINNITSSWLTERDPSQFKSFLGLQELDINILSEISSIAPDLYGIYKDELRFETDFITSGGLPTLLVILAFFLAVLLSVIATIFSLISGNIGGVIIGLASVAGFCGKLIGEIIDRESADDWEPRTGTNAIKGTIPFFATPVLPDETLTIVNPGSNKTQFVAENASIGFFNKLSQKTKYIGIFQGDNGNGSVLHFGRVKNVIQADNGNYSRLPTQYSDFSPKKSLIKIDHSSLYQIRGGHMRGELSVPESVYCHGKDYFLSPTMDGIIRSPDP